MHLVSTVIKNLIDSHPRILEQFWKCFAVTTRLCKSLWSSQKSP